MKRTGLVVCLVVLVFAAGLLPQIGQTSFTPRTKGAIAEQELIKLEQEWTNADLKMDWTTMDRILADDYILTDRDGEVYTKNQCREYYKSGEGKILALMDDDVKVRVYGDAAVVTMRTMIKETYKGKEISDVVRITNTWIKKAGRWQCVSTHSSRIAGK
jgi:ketosteroid isomerase-like protein